MITPPSHQNRFLLYIETQLFSIGFTAMFVSVLKLLHSQLLHPTGTPFPFSFIFGAISSISAIVLGISIAVAMQKRRLLFPSCRAMFQAPFVAAIIYGMYLAFQGPLTGNVSSL